MASPVVQALMEAKVRALIDPPRSWGAQEKAAFLQLPRELQVFYGNREEQRDREVRRCQTERADCLKKLAVAEAQLEEAQAQISKLNEAIKRLEAASVQTETAA
ncbi:hypothetical protein WHZ78_17585 [Bradyrhizobium symbiodeficiens]|uniref:hypothetical protein n=1 Tax=Bradyrhizobium symbiodeficiens TaxID=1404367 RepID=UPI0030CC3282